MKKWQRTLLFWILCFVFLIISPILVLYSQGYRFDFEKKTFVKTGGLFIKAQPKQVEIFLNGKLAKKTDLFFGSALIQNLLPKKYKIEVKKDGFFTWEKNLEIQSGKVTEVKNIILFPKKIEFEKLANSIEDFYPLSDKKRIILKEKNEDGWSLSLYDPEKKLITLLIKEKSISKDGANLISIEETENENVLKIKVGVGEKIKNLNLNFSQIPPILKEEEEKVKENVLAQKKLGKNVYYLDPFGNLFLNQEKLNQERFSVQKETKYSIEILDGNIFLKEGRNENENCFYLLNQESKNFEKILCGKDFKISPDQKKLAIFSKFEIWILFLKDELAQPPKKAGEKFLLLRLSKEIKDLFWINSNYLIFSLEGEIQIAEIDDRDKVNVVIFEGFKNPKIFWNSLEKRVYILDNGEFLRTQPLF
jgi:hypothetical protein